eukprot:Plantae.Rhodophyta-Rhodochaete_pulchella.ctg3551.p2 GENE.Plantae.Rhodophyta-Rhodochaete_pulchella.ctg3551~~Plantae.Rhodophyta-Rhodochaete_pulchella.ctg3551.p2  ORF type:complete len:167 (-),score=30.62 Plantae.Rhodophyta-Rhodochaete_pulchella.ctg3551:589-1089(-)
MLAVLYKDERSRSLPTFGLLESLHMERLIRRGDVEAYAKTLKPHQLAQMSDGSTVLDRAVVEHNLVAASRIYDNVRFDELGRLLEISAEQAEKTAARMIYEQRLEGSLDQVSGMLYFRVERNEIARRDMSIQAICEQVDNCAERILSKYPQFGEQSNDSTDPSMRS